MSDPREPPTFFSATNANPTPPPVNGALAWGVRFFLIGAAVVWAVILVWLL